MNTSSYIRYAKAYIIDFSNGWRLRFLDYLDFPFGNLMKCSSISDKVGYSKILIAYTPVFDMNQWIFFKLDLTHHVVLDLNVPRDFEIYDIGSMVFTSGILHIFVVPNMDRILGYTWNPNNYSFSVMNTPGIPFDEKYHEWDSLAKYNRISAVEHYV